MGEQGPDLLSETAKMLTEYMKQLLLRYRMSVSNGQGPDGANTGGEPRTAPCRCPREQVRVSGEKPDARTLSSRDGHQEPWASSVQTIKPEQRAAKQRTENPKRKTSESKSWVLAKINETEKPLGRLIRKKTRF